MSSYTIYIYSRTCSLIDRIAVVNLLHEARGLDTYQLSLKKFQTANDIKSIEILNKNFLEEIFHVSTALKWFRYLCQHHHGKVEFEWGEDDYIQQFHQIIQNYYTGKLKGPFNIEAREIAGMTTSWYLPLAEIDNR